MNAADRERILQRRAHALAKPLAHEEGGADLNAFELLLFRSGGELMAIPVSSIAALGRAGSITPLPGGRPPVLGVTAWRGLPVAVFSLGSAFDAGAGAQLIILGSSDRAIGALLVDELDDIRLIERSSLAPSTGPNSRFALGVTADALLVIDADSLTRSGQHSPPLSLSRDTRS